MCDTDRQIYAITDVGGIAVAIEAARVAAFEPAATNVEAVDVARLLGVAVPGSARRRVARLHGCADPVLLGPSVRLIELEQDALFPVPELVADHLRALGITWLVALDDGFAYLVAPENARPHA